MGHGFLPRVDGELLAWGVNFSRQISLTPEAYGLTAAEAEAFATMRASFADALAACEPSIRNKVAVLTKNAARDALRATARLLAYRINGFAGVSDAERIALGLTVRTANPVIPRPESAPGVNVERVEGWTVHLRLHGTNHAGRGKPPGTAGATLFSYVGPEAPADLRQWNFEAQTGRLKTTIDFPSDLPPGTRVWVTAMWFNGRKQCGPLCAPVGVNLQGGSISVRTTLALAA